MAPTKTLGSEVARAAYRSVRQKKSLSKFLSSKCFHPEDRAPPLLGGWKANCRLPRLASAMSLPATAGPDGSVK